MYPSTFTSFTNPTPTDRLNSPSHSSIESAQNSNLEQIQKFIGVNEGVNASAIGTILYDIKAPDSDGGGHVQTADKGGTGQTIYTKGDILVAQNSSTLTKLVVGADNQVLRANSSTLTGINWATPTSANKIFATGSTITIASVNGDASIYSVTLPGSTLGTSNALRSTVFIPLWDAIGIGALTIKAFIGGNRVASILFVPNGASGVNMAGKISHTVIENDSTSAQRHYLEAEFVSKGGGGDEGAYDTVRFTPTYGEAIPASIFNMRTMVTGTSSVNSSAPQTLGITLNQTATSNFLSTGGVIIEQIS